MAESSEYRVLVLCPTGRDGWLTEEMLRRAGLDPALCESTADLCAALETGAGCALIAEEALEGDGIGRLRAALEHAPPWSDLPILLLTGHGAESVTSLEAVEALGNVTLLERPVRIVALASAVRAALRARRRQYELRGQLAEREAVARELAERDESLRMAMAAGNMGAYDIDLRTGEAIWTEAGFAILGYHPDRLRGPTFDTWLTGVVDEDRERVLREFTAARTAKSRYNLEYRFRRATDGKEIWLTAVGRFIYDQNDVAFRTLGVFFDSTLRRELEDDLKRMNATLASLVDDRTRELRSLSHHLIEISENEKRALARELHDELGAMMTALLIDLDVIRRKAESPALKDVVERAVSLVQQAAMVKRRIMEGLRPSVLDMMGLDEALRSLGVDFSRRTGIACDVERVSRLGPLDQRVAIALYRIVQEALTNVAKYAGASRVEISLTDGDGTLGLSIVDDGIGLEGATRERRTYGISGMRERVSYLGGEFAIEAPPDARGTAVHVRIPLHTARPAGDEVGSSAAAH